MSIDDKDIYMMMRKDQEKGFRMIMTKFGEPIYWHIRRLVVSHDDAQDAEQNTFIKVFRSFNDLRNPEALSGWIYRIATHEAMNLIAKNKQPQQLLQSIPLPTATSTIPMLKQYVCRKLYSCYRQSNRLSSTSATTTIWTIRTLRR